MTSELELKALEILNKEAQNGHTALPENRLIQALGMATGKKEDDLRTALERSDIVTTRVTDNDIIIRASLRENLIETQVVEQIERLTTSFAKKPTFKNLSRVDMRLGKAVSPSDEQIAAVNSALNCGVSVITGGPGTGKTTMILGLVRAIKSLGLNVTLCAPTGKAAKRLGEATGLQKFKPSTVHSYLGNPHNKIDVMIVDEASMLDISLFNMLLTTIPDGCQLILIGDKDQLPPVASGQPFKDIIQRINRNKSKKDQVVNIQTTKSLNGIILAAYAINNGNEPNSSFNLENDNFEFIECEKDLICDTVLNYYFDKIPALLHKDFEDIRDELQVLSPQRKGGAGVINLNRQIQNKLKEKRRPIFESDEDPNIVFFYKDRVIQTSNNYDLGVMNGEVGTVLSKTEEGLKVLFTDKELVFNDNQVGSLTLAYALTIHKSQGSEYAGVIIPVTSDHSFMLSRNLLYTAVTRGKSKVCLIGEKTSFLKAINESFKGSRYTGLQLELAKKKASDEISISKLTEVYRQKE